MRMKMLTAALAVLTAAASVPAGVMAANRLAAGKYTATLSPAPTESTADAIESQLGKIEELRGVDVKTKDASLHFTVKDGAEIDESRVTDAVAAAAPGTTVGTVSSDAGSSGSMGASTGTSTGTATTPGMGY